MTRKITDLIEDMRNVVKPYIAKQLKQLNFENCGSTDKAEFETEFEMVLTLAEMAIAKIEALKKEQTEKVDCEHTDCKNCINHNFCDYEKEKQDAIESNVGSIKIGDEIKVVKDSRIIGAKGVVVNININNATLGAISSRGYFATWIKNVINTGYHYDIQSIFDDIKSHEREI